VHWLHLPAVRLVRDCYTKNSVAYQYKANTILSIWKTTIMFCFSLSIVVVSFDSILIRGQESMNQPFGFQMSSIGVGLGLGLGLQFFHLKFSIFIFLMLKSSVFFLYLKSNPNPNPNLLRNF
jgi:hypothetical protein